MPRKPAPILAIVKKFALSALFFLTLAFSRGTVASMSNATHIFEIFWVPGRQAPEARTSSIDTDNPDDVRDYQNSVAQIESFREQLREGAYKATGAPHDLPHIDGAPHLVERPWTVTEAGQSYTAWNIFAVDQSGQEHFLSKRMQNIDGGVIWAEPVRSDREVVRNSPPLGNIASGLRCEDCRRFSYEQGQNWLNQVTHVHENGNDRMWRDVVELIAEHQDVEAPNSLDDFGACLEESKLVLRAYPGCTKYSPRGFKKGTECRKTAADSREVTGESHLGR